MLADIASAAVTSRSYGDMALPCGSMRLYRRHVEPLRFDVGGLGIRGPGGWRLTGSQHPLLVDGTGHVVDRYQRRGIQ
jgi:hypothetical protein